MFDHFNLSIHGHVMIKDALTQKILVNKSNAIHPENMSVAIASTLINHSNVAGEESFIYNMAFGNGGIVSDGTGNIIYREPNVNHIDDTLYSQTYIKQVHVQNDIENNTNFVHVGQSTFTDIIIRSELDYNEPAGQDPLNDQAAINEEYVFDELGLVSQQGKLLTHAIHRPVQKSQNRKIQILYTLRISL